MSTWRNDLKTTRLKKTMTAAVLSEHIEVSEHHIFELEAARKDTTLERFVAICLALKITPEDILKNELEANLEIPENEYLKLYKKIQMLPEEPRKIIKIFVNIHSRKRSKNKTENKAKGGGSKKDNKKENKEHKTSLTKKSMGALIRLQNKRKTISPKQFAADLDISTAYAYKIMSGMKGTTPERFIKICNYLKCSPNYFLSANFSELLREKPDEQNKKEEQKAFYNNILMYNKTSPSEDTFDNLQRLENSRAQTQKDMDAKPDLKLYDELLDLNIRERILVEEFVDELLKRQTL